MTRHKHYTMSSLKLNAPDCTQLQHKLLPDCMVTSEMVALALTAARRASADGSPSSFAKASTMASRSGWWGKACTRATAACHALSTCSHMPRFLCGLHIVDGLLTVQSAWLIMKPQDCEVWMKLTAMLLLLVCQVTLSVSIGLTGADST